MFSRSRKAIVLSIMFALAVLLAVTLGAAYGSSAAAVRKQNMEMLERYMDLYSLESLPGEVLLPPLIETDESGPDALPPDAGSLYRLSSFYSAAISATGEILAVDTGREGLCTEEEIIEVALALKEKGLRSGKEGHLLYRIAEENGYTLVAFMDTTVTENNFNSVLRNTLLAGLIAFLAALAAAWFLARRIISPLEENDRRQQQFIADAGHELKTPVAVIGINAEMLETKQGTSPWLSNIQYENERIRGLVTGLLDLSRAENGSGRMERLDFSALVSQEILSFESLAFDNGMTIEADIEASVFVNGNSGQLAQLVSILLDNAVSHGTAGTQIRAALQHDHKQAVLCITNAGEDIPAEVRERLFDRLYRADEARGEGHYGLGLPIAKAVTTSHGGKISMTCADGKISFRVVIPSV